MKSVISQDEDNMEAALMRDIASNFSGPDAAVLVLASRYEASRNNGAAPEPASLKTLQRYNSKISRWVMKRLVACGRVDKVNNGYVFVPNARDGT